MEKHIKYHTLSQEQYLKALELAINHSNLIVWSLDIHFRLMAYNEAFAHWLDHVYQVKPILGRSILELPYKPYQESIDYWKAHYDKVFQSGEAHSFQEVIELDSKQYVVAIEMFPIIEEGKISGLSVFSRKAEEASNKVLLNKTNEQQLKHLINHSGVIFWIATKQQEMLYVSKAVSKVLGVDEATVYSDPKGFWRWIHSDDQAKLEAALNSNAYQEKAEFREEFRVIRPTDGTIRWLLARSFSMRLGLGKRNRVLGIAEDITSLKASQEEAMKTNAQLQNMLEYTQEMIFSLDTNFQYTGFNQRHKHTMEQLFGGSPAIGQSIFDCVPKYAEPLQKGFEEAIEGSSKVQEICFGKGLRAIYFEAVISPIFNPKEQKTIGLSVFVKDITDRKKAEQRATKSTRMLTSINRNIKEAIYRTTPNDVIKYVNQAFLDMFRVPSRKISQPARTFYANPEDRKQIVQDLEKHGSVNNREIAFKKTDGEVFWGLLSSTRAVNERGDIYFDGAIRDITHIKEMQLALEKTNEELTKANVALDSFVYSASHDLKAPLNAISGLIQIFKMDKDEGRRNEYIQRMEKSIKKLENFISDIVDYSRNSRQELKLGKVSLEEIIEDLFAELKYAPNARKLEMQYTIKGGKYLTTDQTRIEAILKNLISNAINYADLYKSQPFVHIEVQNEEALCTISIVDNGIGIKEEYLDKIFDMFYRATQDVEGSGIGLFIVKEALDKLKGTITVESAYGEGSVFTVSLPRLVEPTQID